MGSNELSGGQFLAIGDVSFTKEPCKQIPWKQNEGKVDDTGPFFHESVSQRLAIFLLYLWYTPGVVCLIGCLFFISVIWPLERVFSIKCMYSMKYLECQKDLGMENGEISDRQITASSQLDASHAAIQGRLNLKATGNKAASWSADSNDERQWLQIDLGSPNTKVTRVATQGGHYPPQWVTKYKLQFSNDGVIYHYYTDPRQIENKVEYISRPLNFGVRGG